MEMLSQDSFRIGTYYVQGMLRGGIIRFPKTQSAIPKTITSTDPNLFRYRVGEQTIALAQSNLVSRPDALWVGEIVERYASEVFISVKNGQIYHKTPGREYLHGYLNKNGFQLESVGFAPYYRHINFGYLWIPEDSIHRVDSDGNCFLIRNGKLITNIKQSNLFVHKLNF